jgi:cell division protein FtsA
LSKIIHARVVEIGAVFTEIKAYGHEDPQKLIAGIVLTGGGAVKTHQAVSRIHYGMDTRIGYQTFSRRF